MSYIILKREKCSHAEENDSLICSEDGCLGYVDTEIDLLDALADLQMEARSDYTLMWAPQEVRFVEKDPA